MSSFSCIYCGSTLDQEDSWGSLAALRGEESLRGDILRCPSHEGFDTEEEAKGYWEDNIKDVHSDWEGFEKGWNPSRWEEVCCESSSHNVSGSFYTDRDELYEGYPC